MTNPLQSQPLSPDQIADLVERTRENERVIRDRVNKYNRELVAKRERMPNGRFVPDEDVRS